MTNTRIGDVEVAEKRFPLLLREFSIRRGSGGKGVNNGGDGVTRIYEARIDMHAAHIGERRVNEPYGMAGGGNGERGASYWIRKTRDGGKRIVKMRPSASCRMTPGEQFRIDTPGGGAYGSLTRKTVEEAPIVPAAKVNGSKPYTRANGSLAEYAATQESCD